METVQAYCDFLEGFAPARLAETWDNVGLLIGDRGQSCSRVMTCLTVTPASAAEAIDGHAQLIVSHHPLPFRPLPRITTDTTPGGLIWQLARAGISVYSPHTAFDSARFGINQRLALRLGLEQIEPLVPARLPGEDPGSGRVGILSSPLSARELADRIKTVFRLPSIQFVGGLTKSLTRIGVGCGSAGELLAAAKTKGCHAFVTGETNFHTCLEAEAQGIATFLIGHFASERFGVEGLADELQAAFPHALIWASRQERDPLQWV